MIKSESIKEIASALVKFNSEVSKIAKDANNPFFKNSYATLDQIIEQVRPILTKYGLSLMQIPSGDGQNVILKTLLLHESGEWLESDELIMKPIKNDPQAVGSCITYARRYSLTSFLSLNVGDPDDDGNKATHNKPPQQRQQNQQPPRQTGKKLLSDKQLKLINTTTSKLVELTGKTREDIKAALVKQNDIGEFASFKDLEIGQASHVISWLNVWLEKQQGGK